MALALYRKYRPRTFAEVIGQEHVTEPLMQALRSGRLNHAYLFSGPRGCGKTSSARILARSLNCERGPTPEPCGECDSCVALAPDGPGSIDVIEIDAASHGGVDDARDLRERAIFAPVSSRFKVYVIDEAHMVSSAGFNALLKLVEEPPDYVKFVFATTEPEKVLGTIKSRTHHYPFRLIPPGVLRPYLEQLCESEGVRVEPAVFPLVVRAGGGSARDSLSVLDQLIAGAGSDGVSYTGAVALLGVTDVALIDEMCDALAAGDGAAAYATIDRVVDAGHDPRRFASDLLERLRDLIVLQQVPDAAAKGLIDAPDDDLARMVAQAERFGQATLSRMADIVHNGLTEMRGTTAPRLLLELVCARMLLPGADDSTGALLQRLERMERRLTASGDAAAAWTAPVAAVPVAGIPVAGVPVAGTPIAGVSVAGVPVATTPSTAASAPPDPAVESAPAAPAMGMPSAAPPAPPAGAAGVVTAPVATPTAPAAPVAAAPAAAPPLAAPAVIVDAAPVSRSAPGVIDAAGVRRVWDEVLVLVGRKSKKVAAWAREATVRDVEGDVLVLVFKHSFHATALGADPSLVVEAVYEVLGGKWQVRCEVADGPVRSASASAAARPAPAPRQAANRPAGASAEASASARPSSPPAADAESDWPTIVQPGGQSAAGASGTAGEPTPAGAMGAADGPSADEPGAGRSAGRPGAAGEQGAAGKPSAAGGPDSAGGPGSANGTGSASGPGAADGAGGRSPAGGQSGQAGSSNRNNGGERKADGAPTRASGRGGTGSRTAADSGDPRSAARAAAAGRAANGRSGAAKRGAQDTRGAAAPADSGWDGAPDEPPYDPDYDPPVRDAQTHEGFDPGDEPLDDVIDEQTARQSSEQQALALLRQTLGAEKIGEVDAR
ncbi:DNA polymerase III subunit gamma and tau [Rugosimonospora africana]|uniref:DNA polymerase III subunit gamma/tau n=1 Tax=Rugosimonospora africana TaxID=556532 RepID=A0A8J3QXR7_9ACTN|nr:DNA polymerase III subunit gamma and tau [Rugosimonospora africana]GIH18239.1 hypothetical protein Raf01_64110 [Rugosimonospora africana]